MYIFDEKKEIAPLSSIGVDEEQSTYNNDIITDFDVDYNSLPIISMTELFDNVYMSKTAIVDDFLYAGTYLFAGSPKVGKSFFMAQLGYYISTGKPLWEFKTHKGTCLYMALEDDCARLQKRLSRMFDTETVDNFYLTTYSEKLGNGLEDQLEKFLNKYKDTKLIIIDTLQKIKDAKGEKFSYANDYEVITKLKTFSDKYNICILVVHHTRKQGSEDSFDMISGSNGLLGASDGAFILQKEKRFENIATLDMAGRDQPNQTLHLEFDRQTCLWKLTKAENAILELPIDPVIEKISQFINEENPIFEGTATELVEILKDEVVLVNTITRKLNVNSDILLNKFQITYDYTRKHNGRIINLKKILNRSVTP